MSVLKDVEGRLTEAESQAADLLRRLKGLKSLEQSLGNAVQGIDKASANIGEFASEAGTAAKSLNETLAALRQAVEVLDRLGSELSGVSEKLTAEIRSAQEATIGAVKTGRQETRAAIEDAQREQSEAIKSVKVIGSITLVLVLVFVLVCAWVYWFRQ